MKSPGIFAWPPLTFRLQAGIVFTSATSANHDYVSIFSITTPANDTLVLSHPKDSKSVLEI